jgi:hypothetical protein
VLRLALGIDYHVITRFVHLAFPFDAPVARKRLRGREARHREMTVSMKCGACICLSKYEIPPIGSLPPKCISGFSRGSARLSAIVRVSALILITLIFITLHLAGEHPKLHR